MTKVIIYIKDVPKPIVFTCSESKEDIIKKFNSIENNECLDTISFDNGDFFTFRKSDIRTITTTTEKQN